MVNVKWQMKKIFRNKSILYLLTKANNLGGCMIIKILALIYENKIWLKFCLINV